MEKALAGAVPVFFATIPLGAVIPFDPDYDPTRHPAGEAAVRECTERWGAGQPDRLLVYQRGPWFVVADDYIPLFAALRGLPDYVPCYVLDAPVGDTAQAVQGPLRQADVRGCLGLG